MARYLGTMLIIFFIVLCIHNPSTVSAVNPPIEDTQRWSMMTQSIADHVEAGRLIKARDELKILAHSFSRTNLAHDKLTVAGIHALSNTILNLEGSLNRISPDMRQVTSNSQRLRVAFDAVSNPNQSLWQKYYKVMKKDLTELKIAINKKDLSAQKKELAQFNQTYQTIYPALIISKQSITINKLDSLVTFINKQKDVELISAIDNLQNMLKPLFFGSEKDVIFLLNKNETFLYTIIAWLLAAIMAGFSYVGWIKFRKSRICK